VEAGTLDDQERHLALEISTSRMAHAERERERAHLQNNNKAKPEQLKLSKIYHQRDHKQPTARMQGIKNMLYLYAKPVLRVDPYFHVLTSSIS
jgi:hypothetical protein